MTTRRQFLELCAAAGAGTWLAGAAGAEPLGLPLGLQLYSVRAYLEQDFAGTLETLAKLGYREVEAAGFYGRSPAEFAAGITAAGLRCVSSHTPYPVLAEHFDETLAAVKRIGAGYLICSSPGHRTSGATGALTLDDWRWNAEEFNRMGELCARAGVRFGYHNHVAEFRPVDGVIPYDELLRLTDPKRVTLEMDCGWVRAGGADPVTLMKQHPGRFSMLHVKDFKALPATGEPDAAELGKGVLDYQPIFAEARRSQHIQHVFVEQEHFDRPWQEALKADAQYLQKFS